MVIFACQSHADGVYCLQVADLLHDLDDGMRPISVFFPYLPTPYHKKRDQARIRLGQIFAKVVEARR